jgi:GMP synthase-like glutamine amidotransferase
MKAVAILRFAPQEGPGYFATYLSRRRIPWSIVKVDEGEPLPGAREVAGLAMMGGAMSVNDDLPWIVPVVALVRDSVAADVPVIGHCLGGQLLSKALGGTVTRNAVKEIGWGEVTAVPTPAAAEWSLLPKFLSYHWHGETFSLPAAAVRIWSSPHCENQAFVLGRHFGMQCHIEITRELIDTWCEGGIEEIEEARSRSPAVQTPEEMRESLDARLDALHAVADRVYDRWTAGLNVRK